MFAAMLKSLEHLRVYRAIQNRRPSEDVAPGFKAYNFVVANEEGRSDMIDRLEHRVYWLLTTMVKEILDPEPVGADIVVPEPSSSSIGGGDAGNVVPAPYSSSIGGGDADNVVPAPYSNGSLSAAAVIIGLGLLVLALAANRPYEVIDNCFGSWLLFFLAVCYVII